MNQKIKKILTKNFIWFKQEIKQGNLFVIAGLLIAFFYIYQHIIKPEVEFWKKAVVTGISQTADIDYDVKKLKQEITELKKWKKQQYLSEPFGEEFQGSFGVRYKETR